MKRFNLNLALLISALALAPLANAAIYKFMDQSAGLMGAAPAAKNIGVEGKIVMLGTAPPGFSADKVVRGDALILQQKPYLAVGPELAEYLRLLRLLNAPNERSIYIDDTGKSHDLTQELKRRDLHLFLASRLNGYYAIRIQGLSRDQIQKIIAEDNWLLLDKARRPLNVGQLSDYSKIAFFAAKP